MTQKEVERVVGLVLDKLRLCNEDFGGIVEFVMEQITNNKK